MFLICSEEWKAGYLMGVKELELIEGLDEFKQSLPWVINAFNSLR